MKFYSKNMSKTLDIILNIIIALGLIITAKIYYSIFLQIRNNSSISSAQTIGMILILTIGIISTFLIVFDLKKIIKTITKSNPFVLSNVKSLYKISVECFIITGCYLANILFNFKNHAYRFIYIDSNFIRTDTEPIIFFLAGIFILVLAAVFKEAIKYKEENDYTI